MKKVGLFLLGIVLGTILAGLIIAFLVYLPLIPDTIKTIMSGLLLIGIMWLIATHPGPNKKSDK